MKILLISDFFPPYVGGLENHAELLGQQLIKAGHTVVVATTHTSDEFETIDNIEIYRFKGFFQYIQFAYSNKSRRYPPPLIDPILKMKFRELIKQFSPDIIHIHGWLYNTAVAANNKDIPMIMTLHDYGHLCPNRSLVRNEEICLDGLGMRCFQCMKSEYGLIKTFLSIQGILRGQPRLSKINQLISVSSYVQTRTTEKFPDVPNQVIPNFLNPNKIFLEKGQSRKKFEFPAKFILFVGVLSKFKGVPDLINGFLLARESTVGLKDVHLIIMGPENPSITFKSLPNKNIQVISFPPRNQVVDALYNSTCLVVPSRWPDPCPTVILEGLSVQKSIIGTNVGGIPDLLGEVKNSFIVPPHSPQDIADALEKIFSDLTQKPILPENYLPLAPQLVVNAIEDLYQAAINE